MSDSDGLVQSWSESTNSLKFILYNDAYPQEALQNTLYLVKGTDKCLVLYSLKFIAFDTKTFAVTNT